MNQEPSAIEQARVARPNERFSWALIIGFDYEGQQLRAVKAL